MGVYVKAVCKPKNCNSCTFNYDCYSCIITGTKFYAEGSDGFDPNDDFLDNCPLVEADVVPWDWLKKYAEGKRVNFASDFISEAKRVYEKGE